MFSDKELLGEVTGHVESGLSQGKVVQTAWLANQVPAQPVDATLHVNREVKGMGKKRKISK